MKRICLKTAMAVALAVFTSSWPTFAQTSTGASAELALFGTTNLPPMPPGMLDWFQAQATSQALSAMGIHPMDDSSGPPLPGGLSPQLTNSPQPMGGTQPPPGGSTPAPYYAVIDLGDLGGGSSYAQAINSSGQVVGYSTINTSGVTHAFLYSNGSMQDLGATGGGANSSYAYGINDSGMIVGLDGASTFLYQNGSMVDLGTLGSSIAYAINNAGQITSYIPVIGGDEDGFIYQNGAVSTFSALGPFTHTFAVGINNIGAVVGYSHNRSGGVYEAFLYYNGASEGLGALESGSASYAYGINNNSQVVGLSYNSNNVEHAFLYTGGLMMDISSFGGGTDRTYATGINNNGVIVGSDVTTSHAFVYADGTMMDLNSLLFNPNSGWTLVLAQAINDSGQIVGYGTNSSGQTHAFLLNPLPPGSIPAASTVQTSLPTYPPIPTPTPHHTGLVFITHGWIYEPQQSTYLPEAIELVTSMSNSVQQYLNDNHIENWEVYGHLWTAQATQINPVDALVNAEQIGVNLGNAIVNMGSSRWTNIHFIAHSAGAGIIQKATEVIKASLGNTVTIHCTFLDAFDGATGEMADEYGYAADWADSYFVRDGMQKMGWTGRLLPFAFNVDVTTLDQKSSPFPWYESLGSSCSEIESDHGWPPLFYSNSITGAINGGNLSSIYEGSDYNGFGFPLSEETGVTVGQAKEEYLQGNGVSYGSVINLGPNNSCIPPYIQSPGYIGSIPGFSAPSTIESSTGTLTTASGYGQATTGSPVWVSTVITDTNVLNLVSFNAQFTSAEGAHGLLTVYWDTNLIGEVDEASVQPGLQYYNMQFPNTAPNTSHVLGFHVDPFTATHSTLVLTNIVTGCVGVSQPFTLSITTNRSNGLLVCQLTGQPAYYTVQSSSDLLNWTTIAYLANTNGAVNFVDPNSTNYPCQFYRATSPTTISQ